MGDINFCEDNLCKWVGVRPALYGQQILFSDTINNTSAATYTVNSGKILLLTNYRITAFGSAAGILTIAIRNDSAVVQCYMYRMNFVANQMDSLSTSLFFPIELLEGWDIYLSSNAANCYVSMSGTGILIDG